MVIHNKPIRKSPQSFIYLLFVCIRQGRTYLSLLIIDVSNIEYCHYASNLIWGGGGFTGVRFEVEARKGEGGEFTPPPCLKLVIIMLETSNLACKFRHICSFRKNLFKYQGSLTFADVSIFLQKISAFRPN